MKFIYFTYIFLFACLLKVHAAQQQQPKDCVKHPQIIKQSELKQIDKPKVVSADKTVKTSKAVGSVPHFSLFNVINFFYTKDTLDNLHVM